MNLEHVREIWLFVLAAAGPIAGVIYFAKEVLSLRKTQLENKKLALELSSIHLTGTKLTLEIEKLRRDAAAAERARLVEYEGVSVALSSEPQPEPLIPKPSEVATASRATRPPPASIVVATEEEVRIFGARQGLNLAEVERALLLRSEANRQMRQTEGGFSTPFGADADEMFGSSFDPSTLDLEQNALQLRIALRRAKTMLSISGASVLAVISLLLFQLSRWL